MSLKKLLVKQSQVDVKFRLYLIAINGSGILEVIPADGSPVSIFLEARYIKILLIYNKALQNSKHLKNEAARGWLTNEEVASLYVADDAIPPEPNVFTSYRSHIHGAIKEEMVRECQGQTAPHVFCSERNIGTRLITEIEIINLTRVDIC